MFWFLLNRFRGSTFALIFRNRSHVAVGYAAGVHAAFLGTGRVSGEHVVLSLLGTALKDSPDDVPRLRHYFQQIVAPRTDGAWRELYEARHHLPEK